MNCFMCHKDFCWECLKPFDGSFDHDMCEEKEDMEDVLLAVENGSERYDKYLKIALSSRLARRENALRTQSCDLLKFEKSMMDFQFLNSFFKSCDNRKPQSTVQKLFDSYVAKGVTEQYKSATDFRLQAQFVLEGAAKFVGLSMNAGYHRKLHHDISNLQYVVEKMAELVQDRSQLRKDDISLKLDNLMHHGRKYIFAIGTFVGRHSQ